MEGTFGRTPTSSCFTPVSGVLFYMFFSPHVVFCREWLGKVGYNHFGVWAWGVCHLTVSCDSSASPVRLNHHWNQTESQNPGESSFVCWNAANCAWAVDMQQSVTKWVSVQINLYLPGAAAQFPLFLGLDTCSHKESAVKTQQTTLKHCVYEYLSVLPVACKT